MIVQNMKECELMIHDHTLLTWQTDRQVDKQVDMVQWQGDGNSPDDTMVLFLYI